ncbi:MAG: RHS repeat protein [Sphingomonadales bacterium]|nr:RHS repeat protein [Sphingomonadales bacterium]
MTADAAKDRVTRVFYDRDGRLIGNLDAEGYLTRIIYDKAGQKVQERAYSAAINTKAGVAAADPASASFNALEATIAASYANDRSSIYVYDGQGQLRFVRNVLGQVTSYQYDVNGNVTSVTQHNNTVSPANYNYATVKAAVTTHANDRTSYSVYNNRNQLIYSIDAAGTVSHLTYDNIGQVTKTVVYAALRPTTSLPSLADMTTWAAAQASNSANRITRNWYSQKGELLFTQDAEGYLTGYTYDSLGQNLTRSRWTNIVSASDSTNILNLNSLITGAGAAITTRYSYDYAGRVLTMIDAQGVRSSNVYNALGQITDIYTADQVNGVSSPDLTITHYEYDGAGRMIRQINAYGESEASISQYVYDGLGNLTSVIDPNGKVTSYTYDRLGRMLTMTDAQGGVTSYEYSAFGEAVKATDARGYASYSYYDKLGRVVTVRDAEDYITTSTYTVFGEVASVKRWYNKTAAAASTSTVPTTTANATYDATTSFTYDKLGRVTRSTDALSFYEEYSYDALGNRISSRNKLGAITNYAYDRRGQLLSETLPQATYLNDGTLQSSNIVNKFEYDARGNRTKLIEAFGLSEQRTTSYIYDKNDRLIQTIGQAAHGQVANEYIKYDLRGNVTETVDATGGRTLFFYDDLNRKVAEINAVGTYTKYTYDKNGNVTNIRIYETAVGLPAEGGSEEEAPAPLNPTLYRDAVFTYDNNNRMLTSAVTGVMTGYWSGSSWISQTGNLTTSYSYDANGNVLSLTDPNGRATYSYYDKLGHKTAQVDAGGYLTAWSYDAESNVLNESLYANVTSGAAVNSLPGVTGSAQDRITNYTYDKVGNRLTEQRAGVEVHNSASAGTTTTVNAQVTYTYNGLGQVVTKTEATGDAITYTYDTSGRMKRETRSGFTSHQALL